MRAVAAALYNEPVVFLGVLQGVLTALAASAVITGWVPVVTLAGIVPLTRFFTRADKPLRRKSRGRANRSPA